MENVEKLYTLKDKTFTGDLGKEVVQDLTDYDVLENCTFDNAELNGKGLWNITFKNCKFINNCVIWHLNEIGNCKFIDCVIDDTVFISTNIWRTEFINTRFGYSSFSGIGMHNTKFINCYFDINLDYSKINETLFENCEFVLELPVEKTTFKNTRFEKLKYEEPFYMKDTVTFENCTADETFEKYIK